MFKNYVQIVVITAALAFTNDAIANSEQCDMQREAAKFIVETSKGIPEAQMRKIFPRHTHIIYEIYNSKYPYYVPTKVYKDCIRDLPI